MNSIIFYARILIFGLMLVCILPVYAGAQSVKYDKEHKKMYEEAQFYYQFDNFQSAFPVFLQLYQYDSLSNEINFKLGVCYFNCVRDVVGAQRYFEKSCKEFLDSYYYLGRIYHLLGNFDKAIESYRFYENQNGEKAFESEVVDYYMTKSVVAKEMTTSPGSFRIRNLGQPVNSPYPDYVPVISSDEGIMLFTSRRDGSTGNKKDPNGEFFEDIYISYNKLGEWTNPVNIGPPVNSETHDACISLTQDGQQLFMYRTNKELTGGDIYITRLVDGKWTEPGIIEAEVNTRAGLETSVCLTPDENTLYFSSNREGGYGGMDLYMVKKMPAGDWSLAQNLGPKVNSPYDEDAPYVHPDGRTMYFSSKGHKNMGGFDIFKSELMDDGQWSAPGNMGFPVNSVRDDIYFVVSADAKRGYFSSNRDGGYGNSDIYIAQMPDNFENRLLLKGTVTTNEPVFAPVRATITLIDYESKEVQGIYRTNKKTGKYLMVLQPDKKYKMVIEAKDYHSFTDDIDMTDRKQMANLSRHINLEPIIREFIDPIQAERDSIEHAKLYSLRLLFPDSLELFVPDSLRIKE
ncbi:MAG: hypothetical protein KJ607_02880 [Bacteroidetes bacterium]|nr:hypothetical protein [Bacteroidota bacterium]